MSFRKMVVSELRIDRIYHDRASMGRDIWPLMRRGKGALKYRKKARYNSPNSELNCFKNPGGDLS